MTRDIKENYKDIYGKNSQVWRLNTSKTYQLHRFHYDRTKNDLVRMFFFTFSLNGVIEVATKEVEQSQIN